MWEQIHFGQHKVRDKIRFLNAIFSNFIPDKEYFEIIKDQKKHKEKIQEYVDKFANDYSLDDSVIFKKFTETGKLTKCDMYSFFNHYNYSYRDIRVVLDDIFYEVYEKNIVKNFSIYPEKDSVAFSEEKKSFISIYKPSEAVNRLTPEIILDLVEPFREMMNLLFQCNQSHMYTRIKHQFVSIAKFGFVKSYSNNDRRLGTTIPYDEQDSTYSRIVMPENMKIIMENGLNTVQGF